MRISIDDFGTGYSSLAALQNLSVDEVKIDQSFVRAMATHAGSRAIVRSIIDMAEALKLRVVAEGVEDRATWDVLAGLGCQVAQGYFLSQPLPAAELETWITELSPTWLAVAGSAQVQDSLQERIRVHGARLAVEEEFIARKQVEGALRTSEERTRAALHAAGMGTWDWEVSLDKVNWSEEMEALYGLATGTFEGTFEAFQKTIHPADWLAVSSEIQAALAEHRESVSAYRTVWPDESVHWLETKARGLYAPDGALLRMTGTSMDVTERTQSEEALRASERRFRKQYKGFPLPTYSWLWAGDDFVLQDFNDVAETVTKGHIVSEVGTRASAMYADEPDVLADLQACAAEQRTIRREVHYRQKGTQRERDIALTYVFVPPQTVMVHTEDVTDARQAEQQRDAMARSEKLRALGQMASGIAHDLNQSLMLVASYTDLAREALVSGPINPAELEDLLATTSQAALDGGEIVKRFLLFARPAPEHDHQVVDLGKVVREAAQLTAPRWRDAARAEGRRISLRIEADGHPAIQGSPGELRELMTNVIFNAVDALPAGGTIILRVLAEAEQAIIEIVDSGVGMSPEIQARVFEPFFTTKGESGTGLGLAMVFRIIEQHGGHIEVFSAPGVGTRFRISMPLVTAITELELTPIAPVDESPVRPLRILAVDDEPMMTKAVLRMLRPSGHVVTIAASGEEAMEKLAVQSFDVVVSDMGMGAGMDGWDLAAAVRQHWPGVPFVLATGWGASIDPIEARAKGVDAILAKPYRLADLLPALARSDRAA